MKRQDFAQSVLKRYTDLTEVKSFREGVTAPVAKHAPAVGHPEFAHLGLGQSLSCDLCSVFLDMTAFTSRTFWDDDLDVVHLALAVLGQLSVVIQEFGGYILGFRGDGLFAGFGGVGADLCASSLVALGATSYALDSCQGPLNDLLQANGLQPVQVRAGADSGRVWFTRTGTETASEVNIIGFSTNFAAKCEKYAKSWELVVGEELGGLVDAGLLTAHAESPKVYQRNYFRKDYRFFQFAWKQLLDSVSDIPEELAGRASTAVRVTV